MKRILIALALLLLPSVAFAQCNGIFPASNFCGTTAAGPGTPGPLSLSSFGLAPGGASGNVQGNNGSGGLIGYTNTQLTALINTFTSSLPGSVPASGGGTSNFLRADGTWAAVLTVVPPAPPGGRLTTSSSVCVPTADIVAATAIYYAPCQSPYVPIYNGTSVQSYNFTSSVTDTVGLTLTLGSNWTASTLFDVYATLNGGSPVLCTIPWSSTGFGTSTRTSGLVIYAGLLTNSSPASCRTTNSTTLSVSVNQGTYLGTFLTNGNTGQIDLKFGTLASGGGAAVQGVWNSYNQTLGTFFVQDTSTSLYITSATTTQPYDANTSGGVGNRVTVVQGGAGNALNLNFTAYFTTSSSNVAIGFGWNSTSAFSSRCSTALASGSSSFPMNSSCSVYASAGLNYVQALQWASSAGTTAFQNLLSSEGLTAGVWW